MKIVFFGSDDFALKHCESIIQTKHQIVGCVTQPDKPKGRGLELTASPIKEFALKRYKHIESSGRNMPSEY